MTRLVSRTPLVMRFAPCLTLLVAAFAVAAAQSARDTGSAAPAYRQAENVAILTVHGEIDRVTLRSLERRVKAATRDGATAIVIELDTPGGDAFATLDICHLIKTEFPVNTVAWVRPRAYSAGTFIALACREIVMAPNGRMGDAAPISPFGPIPTTERAKIESPLLAEIIDSARRNHFDETLTRSFVVVSPGLWLLENTVTGARVVVDPEEYEEVFGIAPPKTSTPPPAFDSSVDFQPRISRMFQPPAGRGGAGLSTEEQARQIEFEQQLPPVRDPLSRADAGYWRAVARVLPENELLTLTTEQAAFFGFSTATIATEEELRTWFGAGRLLRYDVSVPERFVSFLMSLPVRIMLIVIFLVALFVELAMPGFGVFGATALVALLLLVGAPWLLGVAQWWTLMLILVGLGLVIFELFVTPGLGVPGVLGGICVLLGLVGTFISGDVTTAEGRGEVLTGFAATIAGFLIAGVVIWLISRQLQGLALLKRLMLTAEISPGGAWSGGPPTTMVDTGRALELGDVGTAVTDLRPSGRADFDGRIVDVHAIDGYVPRGSRLRVTSVGRFEIEVEVVR